MINVGSDSSTGQTVESKEVPSDSSSNMVKEEADTETNTSPTLQIAPTETKEGETSV